MCWVFFADYGEKIVQDLARSSKVFEQDMKSHGYQWFNNNPDPNYNIPGPPFGGDGKKEHGFNYGYWRWGN